MTFDASFAILAAIVAMAWTTEAAAGFGSLVIAMTLGAHLFPVTELAPVLVPLNPVLTGYMVARHHGHIDRALLFRRVLPLMLLGMGAGLALFSIASGPALTTAFGVFIVAVSVRELWAAARPGTSARALPAPVAAGGIFGAGIIHGIFSTGGPMLVYVLGRSDLDKSAFRSTLAVVWLVLNTTLTAAHLAAGRLNADNGVYVAALIPVVALSIAAGEKLHHHLDAGRFRVFVFSLLLVAGLALLI